MATAGNCPNRRSGTQCQSISNTLRKFLCPVCLSVPHMPVVLTCEHRFCWDCLQSHCTSVAARWQQQQQLEEPGGGVEPQPVQEEEEEEAPRLSGEVWRETDKEDWEPEARVVQDERQPVVYECPVCRKPHVLDIDKLQVGVTWGCKDEGGSREGKKGVGVGGR